MRFILERIEGNFNPENLASQLKAGSQVVLMRSALLNGAQARYSFLTARPFLVFRSFGSRCELITANDTKTQFGNPWYLLDSLMSRYELLDHLDSPFPLGGCFGYWGYDLKNFVEPKLRSTAVNDLELPDCHVGFYSSLVVFDHQLERQWIVATGLDLDGARTDERAQKQLCFWRNQLQGEWDARPVAVEVSRITSNLTREDFLRCVTRAKEYIRQGDIYQVNLSQRLRAETALNGWQVFRNLLEFSPAPFAAFIDCGDFQISSSSPELFLRLSGSHVLTRPIKGTRPRAKDPTRDAQLSYELQTSPKEISELVMITDLLRNDLGRVCEYGTIHVPDLVRLERYPQVQHLVSTIEGRLRPDVTHFHAFRSCFPGGSITGAPKFRAMEIIDELELVTRGPYTGAAGYLGFNRESQLSILIRTAICSPGEVHFQAGAGIVADSNPEAEYQETLDKAAGFLKIFGGFNSPAQVQGVGRACNTGSKGESIRSNRSAKNA